MCKVFVLEYGGQKQGKPSRNPKREGLVESSDYLTALKDMSNPLTEWVSAPTEIKSTPHSA